MMKQNQTLGKLAFLVTLVITTSQCHRHPTTLHTQTFDIQTSMADVKELNPNLQGKADGIILPFRPTTDNLKTSILAHPCPEIWLVFPTQKEKGLQGTYSNRIGLTIKIDLSVEAKNLLLHHWKIALTFCYNTELEHPSDAQSLINADSEFLKSVTATQRELEKLTVDAPDGKRQICHNEAVQLTTFLTLAASNIVKEARA